ncbi:MAG: serine/threonine protein kinase [Microcystaceae cyanobacterium]
MSDYPDFSNNDYQILSELGHNLTGGRVTYLGLHIPTQTKVVLKTFQFLGKSDWKATNYDAYQQETEALKRLSHPNIPRYLDTFETTDGFCLVQQYLEAESLATSRNWELQEIKKIAVSVLRILAYLQSQAPSIIHRDIKPENILVEKISSQSSVETEDISHPSPVEKGEGIKEDISSHSPIKNGGDIKVYLVDFGFARIGSENLAASSMVKGTMGFMPPEQLFNRELKKASDLYGLGMTLICLLTGINSNDIGNYMDEEYRIHFQHLIPPMERGWLSWLEKMVNPMVKERYQSAAAALRALESIDVTQLPKVRLEQQALETKAAIWGDTCTVNMTVINPIPNTLLSGWWEVAPNPNDPPHTAYDHPWIEIIPHRFEGNITDFQVKIDTKQLLPMQRYQRKLILHTNSDPETYQTNLTIATGEVFYESQIISGYLIIGMILLIVAILGGYITAMISTFFGDFLWMLILLLISLPLLRFPLQDVVDSSVNILLIRSILNLLGKLFNLIGKLFNKSSTSIVPAGSFILIVGMIINVIGVLGVIHVVITAIYISAIIIIPLDIAKSIIVVFFRGCHNLYTNVGLNNNNAKVLGLLMITLGISLGSWGWIITEYLTANYPIQITMSSGLMTWIGISVISILVLLINGSSLFFGHFFKLLKTCKSYHQNKSTLIKR